MLHPKMQLLVIEYWPLVVDVREVRLKNELFGRHLYLVSCFLLSPRRLSILSVVFIFSTSHNDATAVSLIVESVCLIQKSKHVSHAVLFSLHIYIQNRGLWGLCFFSMLQIRVSGQEFPFVDLIKTLLGKEFRVCFVIVQTQVKILQCRVDLQRLTQCNQFSLLKRVCHWVVHDSFDFLHPFHVLLWNLHEMPMNSKRATVMKSVICSSVTLREQRADVHCFVINPARCAYLIPTTNPLIQCLVHRIHQEDPSQIVLHCFHSLQLLISMPLHVLRSVSSQVHTHSI